MKWTPKDISQWHRWFAWHPVLINGESVWLEYVERRCEFIGYCLGDPVYSSEYRC